MLLRPFLLVPISRFSLSEAVNSSWLQSTLFTARSFFLLIQRPSVFAVRPRLLVSVRNADEARSALLGGADIIDVKEPLNGSLGRASAAVTQQIAKTLDRPNVITPCSSNAGGNRGDSATIRTAELSLAMGEVTEWLADRGGLMLETQISLDLAAPQFLKLGLAELSSMNHCRSWQQAWLEVRGRLHGNHAWVAVAYADSERAGAPSIEQVCAAAIETHCSILLIDTFVKDDSTLLDWVDCARLQSLRTITLNANLQLALAGRVSAEQLSTLLPLAPDIVAVRGAVCANGVRTSMVDELLVRKFVASMQPL